MFLTMASYTYTESFRASEMLKALDEIDVMGLSESILKRIKQSIKRNVVMT